MANPRRLGPRSVAGHAPGTPSSALSRAPPCPPRIAPLPYLECILCLRVAYPFRCSPCSSGARCAVSLRFVAFCLMALARAPARLASLCPSLCLFHPEFSRPPSVLPLPEVPCGGGIAVSSVGLGRLEVGLLGWVEGEGRRGGSVRALENG